MLHRLHVVHYQDLRNGTDAWHQRGTFKASSPDWNGINNDE